MTFDCRKTLLAYQNQIVITDEDSPFEWVGSMGAGPCIIVLFLGQNKHGKNVAVCAHLTGMESENPLEEMKKKAEFITISKAHLVSGMCTTIPTSAEFTQSLLRHLKEHKIPTTTSLGKGVTDAAIHVKTGECVSGFEFSFKNLGFQTKEEWEKFHIQHSKKMENYFALASSQKTMLWLGLEVFLDGRTPSVIAKMTGILNPPMAAFAKVEPPPLAKEKSTTPFALAAVAPAHTSQLKSSGTFCGMKRGFLK